MVQSAIQPHETGLREDRISGSAIASGLPSWYAVYVKSRHEFVAAAEVTRKGMETYLPAIKKVSQWKDRKKLIELPLFPGYVFVRVPVCPGAFLDVLKTRGIVAFVSLEPGAPTPVSADEINSLRILIGTGRNLDVFPGLKEGMKVRLKQGPLAGVEGVLGRKEKELLLSVNVEMLGRSVAVKVTPQDIEAAQKSAGDEHMLFTRARRVLPRRVPRPAREEGQYSGGEHLHHRERAGLAGFTA